MNEQDMFLLSAYIDGQLDSKQRQNLQYRLQNESDLKRHFDQLREIDNGIKKTFNSIVNEPLSDDLQQLLNGETSQPDTASVVDLSSVKQPPEIIAVPVSKRPTWFSLALAASIALGVGIWVGPYQTSDDPENILLSQSLQPLDKLKYILSNSSSGIINRYNNQATVSVELEFSFMNVSGDFCRQYRIQEHEQAFRGIACIVNRQWRNVLLVPTVYQQVNPSNYSPASAYDDSVISDYLQQHMQGIALGEAEEQQQLNQLDF